MRRIPLRLLAIFGLLFSVPIAAWSAPVPLNPTADSSHQLFGELHAINTITMASPANTMATASIEAFSSLVSQPGQGQTIATNCGSVAAGGYHTVDLQCDGTVKAWGYNGQGQLGDGSTISRLTPVTVPGLSNVKAIAAGSYHTVALLNDGTVKAWGYNSNGQLGDGSTTDSRSPITVPGLSNVKAIAAGAYHTVALLDDGTVKAWGYNGNGELGDGSTTSSLIPVTVPGLSNVQAIAAGAYHTVALLDDGTVKDWGDNRYGQLGDGTTTRRLSPVTVSGLSNVQTVAAGFYHTVALLNDGTVKAWGYNGFGELGDGSTTSSLSPLTVSGLSNVQAVAAGYFHTVALLDDGTVKDWGDNGYGQLGNGEASFSASPVQAIQPSTPVISVSPAALPFADTVGGLSRTLALTLTNSGDQPVLVSSMALAGTNSTDFTVGAGSCGSTTPYLAGRSSCTLAVSFTPQAIGTRNATLAMQAATGNGGTSQIEVALSGLGVNLPDAPTIGVATVVGIGQVDISFSVPASDGGSPIFAYTAVSDPPGFQASSDSSPISISGLDSNTTYTFTISATNAIGTGVSSAPSNLVTPATVPGAPTINTATAGNGQASISFTPPATDGGNAISGYTVTSNPDGKTASGTTSPITVAGLTNGIAYTFTIIATNAVGNGPASTVSNSITLDNVTATGTIQLPKSGQTTCFDTAGLVITCAGTGQDGELQKGAAWPSQRFIDNEDQTITDNLTGLIWTKDANLNGTANWQNALNYVLQLNSTNYLGHNDWRLPNYNEMESLLNDQVTDSSVWLAGFGFTDVSNSNVYWTSTTNVVFSGDAWGLLLNGFFNNGSFHYALYWNKITTMARLWPVRGGQSGAISLPKTAQTACYNTTGSAISCAGTGQDGELQIGVVWPTQRFKDNGDQTQIDTLTGLIWSKDGNAPGPSVCGPATTKTWQGALDYVSCLNQNSYLGRSNWRLPNRKEMSSLINRQLPDSSSWLNDSASGFSNAQQYYWTSNTFQYEPTHAWLTSLIVDHSIRDSKLKSLADGSVWPVSDGLGNSFPGTPFNVSATSGNGQATVTFTAPVPNGGSVITGYTVTSSPAGGIDNDAGTTATSHLITGLTNGTAYTFTVTATNAVRTGVDSSPSNNVTPATVPDAPTIGTATASNAEATVTFGPPASDGGSAIIGYTVTSSPAGGVDSNAGTTATSHLVTGLTNGVAYTFTVAATNVAGTGAESAPSNSVKPITVPDAPTSITAAAGNGKATISFTPPASDGGSPVTGYAITSHPGELTVSGPASPMTVIGLINNTAYTFTVIATNEVGASTASSPSNTVMPTAKTLAEAVNNPSWAVISGGNANWYAQTAVSHDGTAAARSGALANNQMSWIQTSSTCPNTLNFWWKVSSEANYDYLRFTIDGVEQGVAPGISGEVDWSQVSSISIPTGSHSLRWSYIKDVSESDGSDAGWVDQVVLNRIPVAASAPVMGQATATSGQATVSFDPPPPDACSGTIVGYTITANPGGMTASSESSPITITGLINGNTYTFTVTATNDAGAGAASAESNPVTPTGVPDAPVIGTATAGDGKAIVSFSPPVLDGGSNITAYTVTSNFGGFTASGPTSPITVTGLSNSTAYSFAVTATNALGTGPASADSNGVMPMRDSDDDGVVDISDNCPDIANADQDDMDHDGVGDVCDILPNNAMEWRDSDGDGVGDNLDNCVLVANASQSDADNDARGDACDSSPNTANYGSVIDAPHNETRGVTCADCHSYSLWWQHSPATASTAPDYAAITNSVCTKCHSNTNHSSVIPGEFTVKCVECHSAHDQAQVEWRTTVDIDDLYLKRGTITGNFMVNGGQTTFDYTLIESYVAINPEWSDFTIWGKKNDVLPPSGLILVLDTTNATNTYEVISATETTITIKGGINPTSAGKSFGLIYGQMIKKNITTPTQGNRDVKFFNPKKPTGGYTDSNTPSAGICQVCHVNTTYWNSDGANTGHHNGVNCTDCHTMAQGFKP